jgi:phage-related protein
MRSNWSLVGVVFSLVFKTLGDAFLKINGLCLSSYWPMIKLVWSNVRQKWAISAVGYDRGCVDISAEGLWLQSCIDWIS